MIEIHSAKNCEGAEARFALAVQNHDQRGSHDTADAVNPPLSILSRMMLGGSTDVESDCPVFELPDDDVLEEDALNEGPLGGDLDLAELVCHEPLVKLTPGPWISLGGYLDYEGWADRERFLELDRAIAARRATEWVPGVKARHYRANWPKRPRDVVAYPGTNEGASHLDRKHAA